MCPANKDADEPGAKFVGGNEHAVVTPDSFKNVYKTVMDAELGPQFGYRGEGKIPLCWYAPILEMQSAASPSIVMFWCLTQGAITVLQEFATQKQQDLFIPKLRTGEWGGTMGLTEPGAGSEVGACKSRAIPTDVPGKYKLTGTKCFISSGDHDLTENIKALFTGEKGNVLEGTVTNVFIVKKGKVFTPGRGVLPGTTAGALIKAMRKSGIKVIKGRVAMAVLRRADEVFLTNAPRGVIPVVRVDGRKIGTGKPGTMTRKIMAIFKEYVCRNI